MSEEWATRKVVIVARRSPAAVLCVTNPVDVMTAVLRRRCGWPRGREALENSAAALRAPTDAVLAP